MISLKRLLSAMQDLVLAAWDLDEVFSTIPGEQAFQKPDPACPLVNG
jgi:hypothetical protein